MPEIAECRAEPDISLLALVRELCNAATPRAADWSITPGVDGWWIKVDHRHAPSRDQGWKLHISASSFSITDVLRRAVPLLLSEDASFKIIASMAQLQALNDGAAGLSQVGKCITVYPNNDLQAVRLALALDRALHGLRGPAIPSDRPLLPGSLVYYRYGSFAARLVQLPNGRIEWALVQPDGTLSPDMRGIGFRSPEWAIDPFVAAGVAQPLGPLDPLIGGRYLVCETLAQSARGTVARALDLRGLRRCVLKRAARDAELSLRGQDARDRLRHEAAVLTELAPLGHVPQVFDLIDHDGDLILVLEDLHGETLEQRMTRLSRYGETMPHAQLAALGCALTELLHQIHERGFVYRDLKPSNLILGPDDHLQLIDLELAYRLHSDTPPVGRGTRGYMSPQQDAGAPPCVADDIYSLGALLYVAATCAEPGFTPRPAQPFTRSPELINPALGPALSRVIADCLEPHPADRPLSMLAVRQALDAAAQVHVPAPSAREINRALSLAEDCQEFLGLARRLGQSLCAAVQRQPGQGPCWSSSLYHGTGIVSRDLYAGNAGVLLALAELLREFDDPEQRALLQDGMSALLQTASPGGSPLAGLYFGEAGVALTALRAGQVLGDDLLITAANERGHMLAALPYSSPDLATGLAGRVYLHLLLWDQTGEGAQLAYAIAAGERLLADGERLDDELCWRMPSGYGSLSKHTLLGYAHGAAGIADALLELWDATRDDRFKSAAHAAARWIIRQSLPALNDGSGLCWPKQSGSQPSRALWCHGAVGIGRFLLHMAQADETSGTASYAARAARTVAQGVGWAGPTQCHGLAGAIELLLDMFQATRSAAYLREAHRLAHLLKAFMIERDGLLLCQSDQPDVFAPDLMLGYGGVILCLLRLGDPEHRSHYLSRSSLYYLQSWHDDETPA